MLNVIGWVAIVGAVVFLRWASKPIVRTGYKGTPDKSNRRYVW